MYVPFSLTHYKLNFFSRGFRVKLFIMENTLCEKYIIKFTIINESDVQKRNEKSRQVYRKLIDIKHPNIVKVYEVGLINPIDLDYNTLYTLINQDTNNLPYDLINEETKGDIIKEGSEISFVVMEYIPGTHIYRRKDLDFIDLLRQLFSALMVLQKYKIVHNDLNFTNIIYDGTRYVLIDFDISYFNSINDVDRREIFINIGSSLFTPDKSFFLVKNKEGLFDIKPIMLTSEDVFSKFYNYAVQINGRVGLLRLVIILSALLGSKIFTLNLEYDTKKEFQYGIEISNY